MAQQSEFDAFVSKFEELVSQEEVSEQEFLNIAQQAIAAYKEDPEKREKLAYKMAGLWFVTEDKMGKEFTGENTAIAEIGGEFADLEIPDIHVGLGDYNSVEEKWQGLEQKINDAIRA